MSATADVFAYHDVGVRCLKVLLAHGVEVALVVTHRDSPGETIWFDSVARTARDYGIAVIEPDERRAVARDLPQNPRGPAHARPPLGSIIACATSTSRLAIMKMPPA